ncbi:DUF4373 domain-containing protein [Bacteroides uniformis]|nr:DUF4373 domain-containing protein [Bacteroides uniformis]
MCDPRMQQLTEKEGLRGLGAYWVIIEKLGMLPEPRARQEYLRPHCDGKKVTLAYLRKLSGNTDSSNSRKTDISRRKS